VVVLVGTAPKQKLESWGDFEGLAEQHSRLSAEAQHRKLILAETLPTDFGGQGVERGIALGSNRSDRIAGMIGRNDILTPVRSIVADPSSRGNADTELVRVGALLNPPRPS
jgi:hypothetical protein